MVASVSISDLKTKSLKKPLRSACVLLEITSFPGLATSASVLIDNWLHLFVFSPLCVFKCVLKLSAREDAKSHWLDFEDLLNGTQNNSWKDSAIGVHSQVKLH